MYDTIVFKLLLVAIILVVSYILLFQTQETFFDQLSSTQVLMPASGTGTPGNPNAQAITTTMQQLYGASASSDSGNLLQVSRCYKFHGTLSPPGTTDFNIDFGAYNTKIEGYFASISDINSKVLSEITNFTNTTGAKIKGNVYALIFHVPYFVNANGNPINIGYDVETDTHYNASGGVHPRANIFYRIYLIFANYDVHKTYQSNSYFECNVLSQFDQKYLSTDKSCFIRCVQSNTACGCASTDQSSSFYTDDSKFNMTCFDNNAATKDQLTVSTYGILFTINKTYNLAASYFG
jgi:hypothetical protein